MEVILALADSVLFQNNPHFMFDDGLGNSFSDHTDGSSGPTRWLSGIPPRRNSREVFDKSNKARKKKEKRRNYLRWLQ